MSDGNDSSRARPADDGSPGTPAADDLKGKVLAGVRWTLVSQVALQGSRILVAVLLARLLSPRDFGLAAMVLVFSALAVVLSDVALGAALVRRPELTEDDRSTAFWVTVAVGIGLTLCGVAVSGPLADFYGEPEVQPLFVAVSIGFVVTALGATQAALLMRAMDFRGLELRRMLGAFAAAAAAVTIALLGFGPWAIIAQELTLGVVSSALLWFFSPWRPRWRFSLRSARALGGFGAKVFGIRLLYYSNRNADNLLIGRFLGPVALGAYALAYNIMLLPLSRIVSPIQGMMFPAFSRIQTDLPRAARGWLRANRMVGAIVFPIMLGLIVLAPDFIPTVAGPQWDEAIPVVQVLAVVGLLHSIQQLNGSVLQAMDRAGVQLAFTAVSFVAGLVAFVAGLNWGIVGVAAAFAIAMALVQPAYTAYTARVVGVSLTDLLRNLAGVAQAAVAMTLVILVARVALVEAAVPAGLRLLALVALGAGVYAVFCAWRAPEVIAELRGFRADRGARRPAGTVEPGVAGGPSGAA